MIDDMTYDDLQMAYESCDGCKGFVFLRDFDSSCRDDCPVFEQAAREIIEQRHEEVAQT